MSFKSKQQIDFSKYVAIGDSITSGYTDGALFFDGQEQAFAKLLADQFKLMGGGDFKQPLMKPDSVGVGFYGNSRLILKDLINESGGSVKTPEYLSNRGDLIVFTENIFEKYGPFNNMSVPSAKLISLLMPGVGNPKNGIGNYNPFFTRMASNPSLASILSDTLNLKPTFFTLFIGNNDVLTYASSGGTMDVITPMDGEAGVGFIKSLEVVVNALTENGAKGAIANLADLTAVPYFTTIPYNGLMLNKIEAEELTILYKEFGLKFQEGRNPFVINDSKTDKQNIRQIKNEELIILEIQLDPLKNNYLTAKLPIPKKYVLTTGEIDSTQKALVAYNNAIKGIAKEKKLALIDVYSFTKNIQAGIEYDVIMRCTKNYGKSIFSLDGLHLNSYGQALLANLFIDSINSTYHTEIELVNVSK